MDRPEVAQIEFLPLEHSRFVLLTSDVIKATKVENAVNKEVRELRIKAVAKLRSLGDGRGQADRDVTKVVRFAAGNDELAIGIVRKSKNIGRFVHTQELSIQGANLLITHDANSKRHTPGKPLALHDTTSQIGQRTCVG